jgi:Uma2 family endonuclease
MAMPSPVMPARRYTVAEVLDFPADGNRYEVVAGELLVTPAPAGGHQLLVTRLMVYLAKYLEPLGLIDALLTSPANITWGRDPRDAEDLVQPDLFLVARGQFTGSWRDVTALDLAVEIVSPSSTRADRVVKRQTYQRHNVATYWVVDPEARLVEVWRPDDDRPTVALEALTWRLNDAAPELRVFLADLFAPPHAG